MPDVSLADAIGLLGVAGSSLATFYQFQRARTLSIDGISFVTWYQFLLMSAFWITYGIGVHRPIIILGSALCAPLQISIVWRLQPWRRLPQIVGATTFIFLCCGLTTLVFGWAAGALGTGVAMAVNRLPQIIQLLRHAGDLGVSVASWSVGAACSVAWIAYYAIDHLVAALIATVAGMVGNLVIAGLATWRHRQARGLVGPLPGRAERAGHGLQLQTQ